MLDKEYESQTILLIEKYRKRFGCDIPYLYLHNEKENDLQSIIDHALRLGRPIPVGYE